jgi:hypothetical protein
LTEARDSLSIAISLSRFGRACGANACESLAGAAAYMKSLMISVVTSPTCTSTSPASRFAFSAGLLLAAT